MEKSKLGLPVSWLAVIFFLFCFFAGYTVALLVGGYILLVEENKWLKKIAVTGLGLMLAFSLLSSLIYLPVNLIDMLEQIVRLFNGYLNISVVRDLVAIASSLINFAQKILFLILTFIAFKGGKIKVPVIEALLDKYMD